MSLKNIFRRKPEKIGKTMLWLFGLPLAWILYIVFSLFIPSFGSSQNALLMQFATKELLLMASVLLVVKYFISFSIGFFISEKKSFQVKPFFLSLFIGLFTSAVSASARYVFDKEKYAFTFNAPLFKSTLASSLFLIITAAFTEEVIYRSYLAYFGTEKLPQSTKKMITRCGISGFLFSAAHFRNPETDGKNALYSLLFYFLFGCFLMFLYLKTRGIAVPLGLHIANNLFDAYICGYENSVLNLNSVFSREDPTGPALILFTLPSLALYYLFAKWFIFKKR